MKLPALLCFLLLTLASVAQTVTPSESTIVMQSPKKIGININGPAYYGAGELYKNLMWRNPGFEPDIYRQKYVAFTNGTTTTFTSSNFYDPVVANFWAGASFSLYRGSPKANVCTGTIATSTASTTTSGPTYTFSSPCSSAVTEGDVIILRRAIGCTPEADWETGHAGWWGVGLSGGKLISECTAPYDGVQSLRLDASVSGSTAVAGAHIDSGSWDLGVLLNGEYTISGYYKTVGSPTFSVTATRNVSGTAGNPFNCPVKTFAPVSGWTAFSSVCTGNETSALPIGDVTVNLSAQNGVVIIDDVAFQKTSGNDPTNTTVFRDELVNALKAHCAGASLSGVPCELRDWAGQNADEIDNTIKPIFKRSPAVNTFNYDYAGGQGYPDMKVGFEEFLELCKLLNAEPYYVLPETTGLEDGSKWIEYLNGSSSSTYGAKRVANGQSASWLSVFPTVHLSMGNENWNEGGGGEGLGYRSDAPDLYYDYSTDAAGVWGAMRAGGAWPSGGTGIDLVLGFQDGNPNYGVSEAMARASANSGEVAPYTQNYVGDTTPLASLWNPLLYEVVSNTTNSASTFYQQGSAVKNYGKLNVYEFDNGTLQGSSNVTQAVLDSFTDAAGYGTATALQALQHLSFGIADQNFFSLSQYYTGGPNGTSVHNWGAVIDMGGSTNAVRPQELAMRLVNGAIIGPMYQCSVASPTTYSLGSNHNGESSSGTPAANNIPQEYTYCFMAGSQRSMIAINVDIANAHAISFLGSQRPSGTVTITRYAPSSISSTNEASGTAVTTTAPQNVAISAATTVTSPSSDTLPPYSVTRYDWIVGGGGSLTSTATTLSSSNLSPSSGGSIILTATVSQTAATGSVTFLDGSSTIGTGALSSGSASLVVNSITPGIHSYVASYGGDSSYAGSASSVVTVTVSGTYLQTTFNEAAAGHILNGTVPSIAPTGSAWSDSNGLNGDWTYQSGGGIISSTADLSVPVLIDAAHPNYTATYTYQSSGAKLLFRYVDTNNYIFANTYDGEIDLYSRVSGVESTLATIYPGNSSAALTVTLNGSTGTITCGGQTASGTIPSSLLTQTQIGFFARNASFVFNSITVTPVGGSALTATTTSLTASNLAPTAGSSLTLTATVSVSAATGTVTFMDGATILGTSTLSGGIAAYTVSSIASGSHSYTAVYGGTSAYSGSTSNAVSVTALISTTTVLTSSNIAPAAGADITLTATLSSSAATGTVTFRDGTTTLGTVALSGGQATYSVSSITVGGHSYTASYGGDSTYSGSSSSAVAVTASGTYLQTMFNEASAGHILNGTVPSVAPAGSAWSDSNGLNGDWTYQSGGGIISSTADLSVPVLIDAAHPNYTATYTYQSSGAKLLFRYVDTNNYIFANTYDGEIDLYSRVSGVESTLATIYPGNSSAALTVTLNGSTGTISCGGQTASGTIPSSLLTQTQIGFFARNASFVFNSITVTPVGGSALTSTTTGLVTSSTSPATGSSVTLTATIAPSAASGTVTFMDGTTVLGTSSLSSGSATYAVSSITAGSHSYTAVYGGSSTFSGSTSNTVPVTALTSTTTSLTSSSASPATGSSVTLTATVSNSAATGTVTFQDGATVLGTGALSGGAVTYVVNSITAGTHSYIAIYGGSSTYSGSTSSALPVTALTATTTSLSSSNNSPSTGASIILAATVSSSAAAGTVTFKDGATSLGTGALSGGVATYTISSIAAGTHSYTAAYGGSSTYSASSSSAVAITALTPTTTLLSSSSAMPGTGKSVTLTATVSSSTATGTVTFKDGATVMGTSALVSGLATYTVSAIVAGNHSYTASYGGDSIYASSTSGSIAVTAVSVYLGTTFNEYSAGHVLNGTSPSTDPLGSTWSDSNGLNGDWAYQSGGGIISSTADLSIPVLIDAAHADYSAVYTYSNYGAKLLFRYVDTNNYIFANTYAGEIDLYSRVGGVETKLATIYPSNTASALTVTLNGATGTIACGGQTASGSIPASLLTQTQMGFFSLSSSFVFNSMTVTP